MKVGTAKVTLTGIGGFKGTRTLEFKIVNPTDISGNGVVTTKLNRDTYTYTGAPIEPTVTVIDNREPTKSLSCQMDGVDKPDYKVSFENNTNVGTANIVVTGIRGYTGTKRVPFAITPADISSVTVSTIPNQTYTGSAITPGLTVQFNGKTLSQGTDYDVRFSNNVLPGTATVVITGKGNFTGSVSTQFTINSKQDSGGDKPSDGSSVPMYRLYNRWSGEHLFTANRPEYDYLASIGWSQEGVAWQSPAKSDFPVYRLYNPYSGDHFYTGDEDEYAYLGSIGWNQEGVSFYSADASTGKPIYRLFNRWLTQGTHLFTTDYDEYQNLGSIGWSQEGIAFYGLNQ